MHPANALLLQPCPAELSPIWELLDAKDPEQRLVAALFVRGHLPPSAIGPVKQALLHERAKKVRTALEDALAAYGKAADGVSPGPAAAIKPDKAGKADKPDKAGKPDRAKKTSTQLGEAQAAGAARPLWLDWLAEGHLQTPSQLAWSTLVGRIGQHPPLPSEVQALSDALSGWPDELRRANASWLAEAAGKGGLRPGGRWLASCAAPSFRTTSS